LTEAKEKGKSLLGSFNKAERFLTKKSRSPEGPGPGNYKLDLKERRSFNMRF